MLEHVINTVVLIITMVLKMANKREIFRKSWNVAYIVAFSRERHIVSPSRNCLRNIYNWSSFIWRLERYLRASWQDLQLEPCADIMVSAATRRSILVGGAALAAKKYFLKIPDKISFYPQNFLMTSFSHQKLQQNKNTANMGSASTDKLSAARRSTKVGEEAHTNYRTGGAAGALLYLESPPEVKQNKIRKLSDVQSIDVKKFFTFFYYYFFY